MSENVIQKVLSVRHEYMTTIFELLKTTKEEKIWTLIELAHSRGYNFGHQFLPCISSAEAWLDMKGHLDTMFDFVSPVECHWVLTGKTSPRKQLLASEFKDDLYGGFGTRTIWSLGESPKMKPTKDLFSIGAMKEVFDPNLIQPDESAERLADHNRISERRKHWRLSCTGIFETVWVSSTLWGFILERGFANETANFKEVGVDFISDILVKADSRGFLYSTYYLSKMLGQDDESIADEFSQAVMLFVSPAELYAMLDLTLEMKVGKYAKPYDPRRVKLA
ncbi:hypothetical protein [Vibrio vulnificus]|uniref:hypothetical protein n=1 Tax=Vibrio vulnificus TaxID=672 RepID=UPI0009B70DEA|nr:hypothetical protein [Vibrio vulnificus]OQK33771.1 hypothetical protein XM74_p0064 [Vibrio vulnificus]